MGGGRPPTRDDLARSEAWAVARDPALALFVRETRVFLVSPDGRVALWSGPDAPARAGRAIPDDLAVQLRRIAEELRGWPGARLERLLVDGVRLEAACRLVTLSSGADLLAVAPIGQTGSSTPAQPVLPPSPVPEEPAGPPLQAEGCKPDVLLASLRARTGGRERVRFLWRTDAGGTFTELSTEVANVVGTHPAALVGRGVAGAAGTIYLDEDDFAGALDRRETISGLRLLWAIEGAPWRVRVEMSGLPLTQGGCRGFGLIRLDVPLAPLSAEPPQDGPAGQPCDAVQVAGHEPAEEPSPSRAFTSPAVVTHEVSAATDSDALGPDDLAPLALPIATEANVHPASTSISERDKPVAAPDSAASNGSRPGPGASRLPRLSTADRLAFREIARALGACIEDAPSSVSATALHAQDYVAAPVVSLEAVEAPPGPDVPAPISNGERNVEPVHVGPHAIAAPNGGQSEQGDVPQPGLPLAIDPEATTKLRAAEFALRAREGDVRELTAILDTATDGVAVIDWQGRLVRLNRPAEALFGYDRGEVAGEVFTVLLAPESHLVAIDYLEGLKAGGLRSMLNDGREVAGRERRGGLIPLFMTMGEIGVEQARLEGGPEPRFCAVLRDLTPWKRSETELLEAKRAAERALSSRADFLVKVGRELRSPLSAVIGFAEIMMEERFGPIGTVRYLDYLRDIHAAGGRVVELVDDLIDLSKIEAGRLELQTGNVDTNGLVREVVALVQPSATSGHVVVRLGLAPRAPFGSADERTLRQILLNVIQNAVKFTHAGGQVIVTTAVTDAGQVAVRVRDTGVGMSNADLALALEPFRDAEISRRGTRAGLGLPLTKALIEANGGRLRIESARGEGTLVEILLPQGQAPAG